jgi:hypothetical protein
LSYKHIIIIIATLFIACPSPDAERGKKVSDHSVLPDKMVIKVGGFIYKPQDGGESRGMMRRSYSVELRGKDLYYSVIKTGDEPNVERVITPTIEQWESFWKDVQRGQLWDWSEEYPNYDNRHGTLWMVEISYKGRYIKSIGNNSYPLNGNVTQLSRDGEYTQPFNLVLQGVSNLLGGLEFE